MKAKEVFDYLDDLEAEVRSIDTFCEDLDDADDDLKESELLEFARYVQNIRQLGSGI